MTTRGYIIPINRNGINRIPNISALRKASFEETVEILYSASMFSELDEVKFL
jgi:DNA-directed RNA polymerase II subunit RPB1